MTDTEISYTPAVESNDKKFIDFREPLDKQDSFTYGKEALSSNSQSILSHSFRAMPLGVVSQASASMTHQAQG